MTGLRNLSASDGGCWAIRPAIDAIADSESIILEIRSAALEERRGPDASAARAMVGGADGNDNEGSELSIFGAFYQLWSDSWFIVNSADSDLPGRWKPKAAFIHPRIYLIGGSSLPPHYPGGTLMNDAISYDLEQDAWATLPAAPRHWRATAGNRLALWGGRTAAAQLCRRA